MARCSRVGCPKEGTRHSKVDMGNGLIADVWACDDHYSAIMDSLSVDYRQKRGAGNASADPGL
jgi:hypothetical protein